MSPEKSILGLFILLVVLAALDGCGAWLRLYGELDDARAGGR
jgi:hypothetical protein